MPPSPELRRGRASVTPESGSWRSCLALKRIATGTSPPASVSDTRVWQLAVLPSAEAYCAATPTECACPSSAPPYRRLPTRRRCHQRADPLNEQLCLQWRRVPDASRNKMMQLVVIARRKPLRHWLNALAIAGSDQPCHIKRTHSPAAIYGPGDQNGLSHPRSSSSQFDVVPTMVGPPKADHP